MKRASFTPALAALLLTAHAGASGAERAPAARATPAPCSSVPDLPNDLTAAFAYDLGTPAILTFLTALKTVPESKQPAIFAAAVKAAHAAAENTIAAPSSACPTLDEIYGETRALTYVASIWTARAVHDDAQFSAFAIAIHDALVALADGDALPARQREAALAVFAGMSQSPGASAAAPNGRISPCTTPDTGPRVTRTVDREYPAFPASAGTSGNVVVEVRLNASGDVRSVRYSSDTLKGMGYHDLIRESIFSAAAATWAPAIVNCQPAAGTVLSTVEYTIR